MTAAGITVTDEIVEAAARADHAHGRLAHDPDWDDLNDTDRDSYRQAARSYLTAAAPLIAAEALREAAQAIRDHDGTWGSGHPLDAFGEGLQAAARIVDGRADELEREDGRG